MLSDEGYIPDNAETLVDDDYVLYWARGELLAAPFFPAWIPHYQKVVKEQGHDEFPYRFVQFPRFGTVEKVPAAYSIPGVVVSGATSLPAQATYAARLLVSPEYQARQVALGQVPNRSDVVAEFPDEHSAAIADIVARNGLFDLGITTQTFSEVRAQGFPELQAMFTGRKTPLEAVESYAANVNEILSR
jgi:ABC-type glycerol-3-phosphate transport system substrate-binding protein